MAMQEMRDVGVRAGARRAGGAASGGVRGAYDGGAGDDDGSTGSSGSESGRGGGRGGLRLRVRAGVVPRTMVGRVAAGATVLGALGLLAGAGYAGEKMVLRDARFAIPASSAIQIEGNSHLTRGQLLSVFGEDVDRNVLTVPLGERRAELERLPWVKHATVMRLLPNRLRVAVVERTPVAFVREGKHIGLVDEHGVLLDLESDDGPGKYSFPVVTGIAVTDPLSVRAARMRIFERFRGELDRSGENISGKLSEVDLSNPEDVKALIPDGETEVLVHFGDTDFLERYRKFEEQMPGWRRDYPKLASADMRYERQVVLEMQAGAAVPVEAAETGKHGAAAAPKQTAPRHEAAGKGSKGAAHKPSKVSLQGMGQPHFPER